MKPSEEKELIKKCIDNDRRSQEILYRYHADKMYNVCLIYTKNEDEACDVLQEAFIKIFKSLSSYHFNGSFEGWIRRIIVNTALSSYQKKKRDMERDTVYFQETGNENVVDDVLENINAEDLIQIVNGLPYKAAMVLKLFAIEGYEHKEIAKMMNISEGTSKSQLNRARGLLKDALLSHESKVISMGKYKNDKRNIL